MNQVLAERMSGIPLSGIREIFEKAQTIPDVIRLEFGEPDLDTPDHIKKAASDALQKGITKYTSSFGTPQLRETIAKKMVSENGVKCTSTNVVVTTGATSGLSLSILATMNPGDEVLVPDPGWANYVPIVRLGGAVPIGYPLLPKNNFELNPEVLEPLITPKTRMILINTPSNPTGAIIRENELRAVGEIAVKHNLMILSDEVYERFVYDGNSHVSLAAYPEFQNNVITINAFSKTYSMTGWRLGYVVASPIISEAIGRLNGSTNSCAASMTQAAGVAALTGPQDSVYEMVKIFANRRKVLLDELSGIKTLECHPPGGAFYAFTNSSKTGMNSMTLAMKLLVEGHVATVPGSAFGENGEGHIRIAYANSEENLKKAVSRIKSVI